MVDNNAANWDEVLFEVVWAYRTSRDQARALHLIHWCMGTMQFYP